MSTRFLNRVCFLAIGGLTLTAMAFGYKPANYGEWLLAVIMSVAAGGFGWGIPDFFDLPQPMAVRVEQASLLLVDTLVLPLAWLGGSALVSYLAGASVAWGQVAINASTFYLTEALFLGVVTYLIANPMSTRAVWLAVCLSFGGLVPPLALGYWQTRQLGLPVGYSVLGLLYFIIGIAIFSLLFRRDAGRLEEELALERI